MWIVVTILSVALMQADPSVESERPQRDGFGGAGRLMPFGNLLPQGAGPGPRGGPRIDDAAPTDEEWEEIAEFMQTNSPHRWSIYEQFERVAREHGREGGPIIENLRRRMAMRYRHLRQIETERKGMYDFILAQGKLEDDLVRLLAEGARGSEEEPVITDEMRDVGRRFVENSLDERRIRIARLREALQREEAELERDRSRIDELVLQHIARFRDEARAFNAVDRVRQWREGGGPRGPGMGPGPGGRPGRPEGGRPPEGPRGGPRGDRGDRAE